MLDRKGAYSSQSSYNHPYIQWLQATCSPLQTFVTESAELTIKIMNASLPTLTNASPLYTFHHAANHMLPTPS
jgi:hypothetical protein